MKAIERNISMHENGFLYFVARRGKELIVRSFGTKNLDDARRRLRREGTAGLIEILTGRNAGSSEEAPGPAGGAGAALVVPAGKLTLSEALQEHDRGLVLLSAGAREMAARGKKAILKFSNPGEDFSPVGIWTAYRLTGLERKGVELGSAANHLRWYLYKFVPWAVGKGFLSLSAVEDLKKIPLLQVNPRRIRVPAADVVGDFLAMVESEDAEGGAFLRFLAVTGLRRSGALGLKWSDVDLGAGSVVVRQKGGKEKVLPMTPEAIEVLRGRKERRRPWDLDQNALEKLERKMKRFAKGFEIDLNTFHAFRHYFATAGR